MCDVGDCRGQTAVTDIAACGGNRDAEKARQFNQDGVMGRDNRHFCVTIAVLHRPYSPRPALPDGTSLILRGNTTGQLEWPSPVSVVEDETVANRPLSELQPLPLNGSLIPAVCQDCNAASVQVAYDGDATTEVDADRNSAFPIEASPPMTDSQQPASTAVDLAARPSETTCLPAIDLPAIDLPAIDLPAIDPADDSSAPTPAHPNSPFVPSGDSMKDVCVTDTVAYPPVATRLDAVTYPNATGQPLPEVGRVPVPLMPPAKQECIVRDPETASPLLTITMMGKVDSSEIDPGELAMRHAATQSMRRLPPQPRDRSATDDTNRKSNAPKLLIEEDAGRGNIRIDATNTEIKELLNALADRTGVEISYSPLVVGTLSARVAAEDPLVALRILLEPFDFQVVGNRASVIVRAAGERADQPLILAGTQRQTIEPQPPLNKGVALVSNEVAVDETESDLSPQSRSIDTALSNESDSAAPQVAEASPTGAHAPEQPLAADVQIALLAQDAFGANQGNYALDLLSEGVVRYPKSQLLFRLLGEGYLLRGDTQAAITALERVLTIDKSDPLANELMGQVLERIGQPQRADHYLLQSKTLRHSSGM